MAQVRRAIGRQKALRLLGVRAVIAESFERIHRSNLIGMVFFPYNSKKDRIIKTLGISGSEVFDMKDSLTTLKQGRKLRFQPHRKIG